MTPLVIFLLACAMVFLGCVEWAFSTLMRLSLRLMAERGGRDDRLGRYLANPLRLFVPLRLLIAAVLIVAAVSIAGVTGAQSFQSIVLLVVSLTVFVLFCEHVIPCLIVRRNPEAVLDTLLPVFHGVARVVEPPTLALIALIEHRRVQLEGEVGAAGEGGPASDAPVTAAADEGIISDKEGRELLQSVVDFTETLVKEVMTPRPDMVAVPAESSLSELRDLFREQQYSRMPVYRDSLDNILGIVFVKDLVALPPTAEPALTTLMRGAYFVPESRRVSELLRELQRRQSQMAVVVDEYGGTAGLVTLEDLLEEIVGEIRDEHDVESEAVTDEGDGDFVMSGRVSVDEVADRLGVTIEREGFDTLGGLLLSRLGRMPYVGGRIDLKELSVEILEVERRRIAKVRLRRRETSLEPPR